MTTLLRFLFVAALLSPNWARADEPNSLQTRSETAIRTSLPYLQQYGRNWMDGKHEMQEGKSCVSCHYVNFGIWSQTAAERAGLKVNKSLADRLSKDAVSFIDNTETGRTVTWSHAILALQHRKSAESEKFSTWSKWLQQQQKPAGYWEAKGQFPTQKRPIMESNAVATMWTIAALRSLPENSDQEQAIKRATDWLAQAKPGVSTEWLAWKMIVDHQAGMAVEDLRKELLARQNEDGGFGWKANQPSDAYSTGQVIYALLQVDVPLPNSSLEYLLDSQSSDGEWVVSSELISKEADEYKDHIYTYWGTAWSTIALSDYLLHSSIKSQESPQP